MRKCSVRWYSSSSLRYCFVSVSRRRASACKESYTVEALNVRYVLVHNELELIRELCCCAAASTRACRQRHVVVLMMLLVMIRVMLETGTAELAFLGWCGWAGLGSAC